MVVLPSIRLFTIEGRVCFTIEGRFEQFFIITCLVGEDKEEADNLPTLA